MDKSQTVSDGHRFFLKLFRYLDVHIAVSDVKKGKF